MHTTLEEKLNELKAKVERIENAPKDVWDRLQVIGTLLVPVVIALAANYYTSQMKQAEIHGYSQCQRGARDRGNTRGSRLRHRDDKRAAQPRRFLANLAG